MPGRSRGYLLSPLALSDLEEIWLYTFENWSLEQADRYVSAIAETCRALASGTKTGRTVDVRDGYFKCPVGAHLIFYHMSETGLVVRRVLHQRMDVGRHL